MTMPSSGILCRVALLKTDISEELIASIIRVTRIGELGTLIVAVFRLLVATNVVPGSPILVTLMMEVGSYKSHTTKHSRRRHS
jgi:hypothetical protein